MKKYYKSISLQIFLRVLFHFVYISAIAALPYVIKAMIDCGFVNGMKDVVKWTSIFAMLAFVGMLAQYITQRSAWSLDRKFYKTIRQDYFEKIIKKDPGEFASKEAGEYSSELVNDISCVEEYIEYVMEITESVIDLLVYALYIFLLDYRIATIIYITAILVLFLPRITGKGLSTKKNTLLAKTGQYTNVVINLIQNFSFIDKFTISAISGRHKQALNEMEESRYEYGKYKTFANVLNGSVMYVVNTAAFVIIAILLCLGSITVGVATATISYVQDFMYPLRTVIDSINSLKSVTGVKERIIKELSTPESRSFNGDCSDGAIELKDIVYSQANCSINGFTHCFEMGKKYAIIGENGTGKSTLLKIIMGITTPDNGTVNIGNKKADFNTCNSMLYYLPQNSDVYSASFKENITVFGSYKERQKLVEILNLQDFGNVTESDNCDELSGGEKQLVLLIRALLSGKDYLLLDEPFSAMSAENELKLTRELLGLNKAIIMVTHNNGKEYLSLFDEIIEM
ncbi:MAG: ABC transporter ATP-binding protein/permease [Lachnospiraceae bacterium]|nr:ABC transporter ATP-binding protein/permease [Lachnospiraceae bacterium]